QVRHILEGCHLRLRNLDLNLKPVAAARVPPEIEVRITAGRCRGRERPADIGGGDTELPGPVAVDLDLKRRIVERLRILQVAQRVDLHELRPDSLGEGARRRERRTLYRDLDGSRRAEAHDLTDDVGRLEGDRHVGQRLLQVVT